MPKDAGNNSRGKPGFLICHLSAQVKIMKVIVADSGAALLDNNFQPTHIVASADALVEPPYRQFSLYRLVEPIFH